MRRRAPINVWPAFADLMTVLAVCGLFTALALSQINSSQSDLLAKLRELEQKNHELEVELRAQREREADWSHRRKLLEQQVREAAMNEKMFKAIQEAQRIIDQVSSASGLSFGSDQSLQFGDDLVAFRLNETDPIWQADSRVRLQRFCSAVSDQLAGQGRFIVQVEGHTDSIGCPGDRNCNWAISSARAAKFVAFMHQESYCPGGYRLILRPIGFADTKPVRSGDPPTRRIAVRLVPNYDEIIKGLGSSTESSSGTSGGGM
jgi:flagellar motor protein MotB